MNGPVDPCGRANPFSTRFTRPGAVAYRFPAGLSAATLVQRLSHSGWQGQILGPHGSGKSALVAALIPAIKQAGRQTVLIELHDQQRRLPDDWLQRTDPSRPTVVIVDGCEQLASWNRAGLKRSCRRRGLGLLVTTHRPLGLPDLYCTSVDLALAQEIVRSLLGDQQSLVAPDEVKQCFERHQGNLREALFDLYDLYEERRPDGPAS